MVEINRVWLYVDTDTHKITLESVLKPGSCVQSANMVNS